MSDGRVSSTALGNVVNGFKVDPRCHVQSVPYAPRNKSDGHPTTTRDYLRSGVRIPTAQRASQLTF
eukprot:7376578-Prymnesium_polylepis.2